MHKTLGILMVSLLFASCATIPPAALPKPQPAAPLLFGTPTKQPVTPALQALMDGQTDQQMLLRFNVRPDGSTQNPQVVYTNLSAADAAKVLATFQAWRFKPALAGGQTVARDFIYSLFFGPNANQQRTRFMCRNEQQVYAPNRHCEIVTVGEWRIYRMDPVYPPELLSKNLAGSVTLSFDIGPQGQALKPSVVSASPPGLFNAAALMAVKRWYLEPLNGNNGVSPTQHVIVTVKFTPPTAHSSIPSQRHMGTTRQSSL